ncbi:uncharacterized protein LAESUDRAFT_729907 [Laetiporus sulphureus 93-53]|uniref:Uncharacterized protein n=1 Tax=Laetiporus sulphureus 93-53 TaxID=1314785 RepID=A0A165CEE4_9APHY|nr:uncharacterized protein LAESUDRAFT_729907 [Laetiporus sulphureus 93-53]KZT02663.1 hypothetical protein LAESUDRAFT_729907 [Laetiporus sulphureus 93-53]
MPQAAFDPTEVDTTIDAQSDNLKYLAVVNPVDKAHFKSLVDATAAANGCALIASMDAECRKTKHRPAAPHKHPIPAPSTSESRSIHDGGLTALNAKFEKLAAEQAITNAELRQTNKTNAELRQTNTELRQRNAELCQTNAELRQTNAEFRQTIADLHVEVTAHDKTIKLLANRAIFDEARQLIAERYGFQLAELQPRQYHTDIDVWRSNIVDTIHACLSDTDKAVLDKNTLDVLFDSGSGSVRRQGNHAAHSATRRNMGVAVLSSALTQGQREALRNLHMFVVGEEPAL